MSGQYPTSSEQGDTSTKKPMKTLTSPVRRPVMWNGSRTFAMLGMAICAVLFAGSWLIARGEVMFDPPYLRAPAGVDENSFEWSVRRKTPDEVTAERAIRLTNYARYRWPPVFLLGFFFCWLIFAVEGLRGDLRDRNGGI